jgi:hypothetical protein
MYHAATGMTLLLFDAPDVTTVTAISTSIQGINRLTNVQINRLRTTAEFVDGLRLAQKTRPLFSFRNNSKRLQSRENNHDRR